MAFQIALTADQTTVGLDCPQAYARISALSYITLQNKIQLAIDCYATQAAREAGKTPVSGIVLDINLNDETTTLDLDAPQPNGVRAALYTWLKETQPFFASALDV